MAVVDLTPDSLITMENAKEAFALMKTEYEKLPESSKDALKKKWTLKLEGDLAAHISNRIEYLEDDQKTDRARLVKVDDVLQAIQKMESSLVDKIVLSPSDVIWKRYYKFVDLVDLVLGRGDILWAGIKILISTLIAGTITLADVAIYRDLAIAIFASVIAEASETFSVKAFAGTLITMLNLRDKAIAEVRKKVLPQRRARRFRRKKITRRL